MEDSIIKTIVKGAKIVFIGIALAKLLGYFYTIIVARLGPSDFGVISLATTILIFAGFLVLIGLDGGVSRYVAYYNGKNDKRRIKGTILFGLKISFTISIIFTIITVIFSKQISSIFNSPELSSVLRVFILGLPFYVLSLILISAIDAFKKVKYSLISRDLIGKISRLGLVIAAISLGFGLLGVAVIYVISLVLTFIAAFYYLNKKVFPFLDKNIESICNKKEILMYSWPLMMVLFFGSIISWTDTFMLGYFKTTADVGIYNVSLATANLMLVIPIAFMTLAFPAITELYAKKKTDELKRVYNKVAKLITILVLPLFLLMIIIPGFILNNLFGKDYSLGIMPLIILAVGYFIYAIFNINMNFLKMVKRTKLIAAITLVSAILNVILNLMLIPKYGMIGGAIATSAAFINSSLWVGLIVYKNYKLHPFKELHKINKSDLKLFKFN